MVGDSAPCTAALACCTLFEHLREPWVWGYRGLIALNLNPRHENILKRIMTRISGWTLDLRMHLGLLQVQAILGTNSCCCALHFVLLYL